MSRLKAAGRFTSFWSLGLCGAVRVMTVFIVSLAALAFSTAPASAVTAAPAWLITTVAVPTVMPAGVGQEGNFDVVVENVGGAESSSTATLKDVLSPGMNVEIIRTQPALSCEQAAMEVECGVGALAPGAFVVLRVIFKTTAQVGSLENTATMTGGGAGPVSRETSMRVGVGHEKGPGGIAGYGFDVSGTSGGSDVQAGGHPTFATTSALFNNEAAHGEIREGSLFPIEHVKDLSFYLPLGFFGNPQLLPRCTVSLVEPEFGTTGCPAGSRVGATLLMILAGVLANTDDPSHVTPVYNVTPEKGYAAEFAFSSTGFTYVIYASVVRHDGGYVLRISLPGVPLFSQMFGVIATFEGDIHGLTGQGQPFDEGGFLTNPSVCGDGPIDSTLEVNTWEHPDISLEQSAVAYPSVEGCDLQGFAPAFSAIPETTRAEAPSGYSSDVQIPQAPQDFTGLGTPPTRDVSVTLPQGTTLSPSAANGLAACQQTGPEGINIEGAEAEAVAADGLPRPVAGHCPAASRVGTVSAVTPLLSEPLEGHIFLATPKCGATGQPGCTSNDAEDGNLFGLYVELQAPGAGVIVKVSGSASVNPVTGQVTATFDDIPQFPLSSMEVDMNGGPRAPLANPAGCGTAGSSAQVTPWSSSTPATLSSSFDVDWDGNGGGCPTSPPFAPVFSAGMTQNGAGAFSPFTLTLKREDREQNISSLTTTLPPGLLAMVSKATQCPEPLAAQGSCPAASQVGSVTVGVGPGSDPIYETGKVYFTGPYDGAPFGLSVLVPAVAGPFNLGNVLVRVTLLIDSHTAQVTAVSGAFPQILDGIPLRIRTLSLELNTPDFTFNPTNCNQLNITATVDSSQGTSTGVSTPFAAAGCKNLPFKPTLSASTRAKTTKTTGASLTIKVGSGPGQANIAKVRFVFPKQLPARLTTLQKACIEAQFNTNPAGCPAGSVIGSATAHTPVLAHALTGPIYLVSHGGAAFPDAVVILQGEGVLLYLDGNTNIKHGITTSTFNSVPDAPISSFEAVLPQGAHSAFATDIPTKAKGDLCGQSLTLPATITGQNGAQITQNTKIGVSGCPKAKKKIKAKKKHKGNGQKGKR